MTELKEKHRTKASSGRRMNAFCFQSWVFGGAADAYRSPNI